MWIGIAGVLMHRAIAYQDDIAAMQLRLRSSLIPGYPVETGTREMAISESDGGDYLSMARSMARECAS